ncbi:DUF4442 domain-containing protein [Hahella sp. SMD15-11]|uniref:DUF4442 domain-containing protein n=1 Tax=Thermohahella caldifontis TaxID=3142973 RepID=A0AB39UV73_9GAMM
MAKPINQLDAIVSQINRLPRIARVPVMSMFFHKAVKFTGTAGIEVEELTYNRCVVSLKNKKKVQNHIGSVHAVASTLIAESATGFMVGINIPETSVPVIKTMKLDFVKRAKGDMRAEATLTQEQIDMMRTQEKGETSVKVVITDGEGKEPILAEMIWAWTPKKR